MRILFLSDNFPPEVNACASRVYERACYWVKWGHQVTVITSVPNFPQGKVYDGYKNKWYQVEEVDGIRVVRVKTFIYPNKGFALRILDFLSFMLTSFIAGLFQKKPDAVVATSPQLFCAASGWLVSLFKRTPFIFELSDLWPASIAAVAQMKPGFTLSTIEKFELFLYCRAQLIITLTQAFKDNLIQRGINAEKIYVVTNGVDLPRYAPTKKNQWLLHQYQLRDKFIVSYIGTLGMAHGLENVLAAAQILSQDDRIRLLFVGEGAEKAKLVQRTKMMNLSNVIFVDCQPKEQIPHYWALADIALVHLKNHATFQTVIPSKIFEAMAMGKPILFVGPQGEASKIIEREQVGICIGSHNPIVLANTIQHFIEHPELQASCAQNSLQAAQYYTREKQAHDMLQLINSAANA